MGTKCKSVCCGPNGGARELHFGAELVQATPETLSIFLQKQNLVECDPTLHLLAIVGVVLIVYIASYGQIVRAV